MQATADSRTITRINEAAPKRVLLSAHDTCDHALDRLAGELNAETAVLEAGADVSGVAVGYLSGVT
jgi:hypothetical protein